MDNTNESLARRLRYAALDRVHAGSERVDNFVLDPDGVIDLREFDCESERLSIAAPAAALASIRGQLGDAGEISGLYDDSEPQQSRWRRGPRARHTIGDDDPTPAPKPSGPEPVAGPKLPAISRLSMVPIPDAAVEPVADDPPVTADTSDTSDLDLRDEDRPTAECPQCAGLGHRDLFDRFSQVEFYSCDACAHMWQQDRG